LEQVKVLDCPRLPCLVVARPAEGLSSAPEGQALIEHLQQRYASEGEEFALRSGRS
jgi:hypothetical protein